MSNEKRLLVFDCHEAWVYQLHHLDMPMDVIVGLRGRTVSGWDEAMRPVPANARLIRLEQALRNRESYECVVTHNLTDLLDVKAVAAPRLLVLHETLDGAMLEQGSAISGHDFRYAVSEYVRLTGTHVVAVSKLKGQSWGFEDDVVPCSVDADEYPAWQGDLERGLRVSNHVDRRKKVLMWDFHQTAFGSLPMTLVGRNPGMNGVRPSSNWQELKETLSHHRFFVHTAEPGLEDGYNMATLEAMAAGLPILGNCHPTSPVEHGVSGFLSDNPWKLRGYAELLLANRELAARMGHAARVAAAKLFSPKQFIEGFERSLETASRKYYGHHAPAVCEVVAS